MSDGVKNVTAYIIMLVLGFLGGSLAFDMWNLLLAVIEWYA